MSPSKLNAAADKAHVLDDATQKLLGEAKRKNNRATRWFIASWTVLLLLGLVGIFYQNHIATANKQHIDCIVKLLATPLPPGTRARILTNASTTCNIKFTQ